MRNIFQRFYFDESAKFMRETLEGLHDDDCDIKIKINSIPTRDANIFLTPET